MLGAKARRAIRMEMWVPKTCATWADALQIMVGLVPHSGAGGQVLVGPEMG
jgi:hypothetical protein